MESILVGMWLEQTTKAVRRSAPGLRTQFLEPQADSENTDRPARRIRLSSVRMQNQLLETRVTVGMYWIQ